MRAARIHRHGGPDVLQVDEVPEPVPGPGDLLVRLRATSVNHRDIWIRKGHTHPGYQVELPAILGIDVCGDVVGLGVDVEGFAIGDRVTANPYMHCGYCRHCRSGRFQYCPFYEVYNGAYAEYLLVPSVFAIRIDPGVPDECVACFPNAYITAWQMLVGKAGISPADTVLVWAGTSGLGSAGIEIAKLAGARVIATAGSKEKRRLVAERGVDIVLDHHAVTFLDDVNELTHGEGVTVVFEHVGQATWGRSLAALAPGGTIVSAGATSGDDARLDVTYMFAKQARILGSRLGTMEDALAAAAHLNAGHFSPLVGARLSFDNLAEGHRLLEAGEVAGKIIVQPTTREGS